MNNLIPKYVNSNDCTKNKIPQIGEGINMIDFQRFVVSPASIGCVKLSFNIVNAESMDSTKIIEVMNNNTFSVKVALSYKINATMELEKVITQKKPYRLRIQKMKLNISTTSNIKST